MSAFEDVFARHNLTVAQALLTFDDTERRRRWLNARATLETLLTLGAVPIINENDTVGTVEIRYGDNDRLAARVAQMISADALILFSDVDGLYDHDPRKHADAHHIPHVGQITPAIEAMAGPANTLGTGGMRTKIEAAKIATAAGCAVAITKGAVANPIAALQAGARTTWFLPQTTVRAAYKSWIAGALSPRGTLVLDAGAAAAVRSGKSLLVSGVSQVRGDFEKGDTVRLLALDGAAIGSGIVRYDAADATRIRGLKSAEILPALGFDVGPELVHADDLVLTTAA